jgi:hypothetical protein
MTVTTIKAAIELIREPDIDSLWEYEGYSGKTLYAGLFKGQYCDIYGSCTALKHDGKITGMGRDFIDSNTTRTARIEAHEDRVWSIEKQRYVIRQAFR